WHAVASWTWDAQDETCGICRMAFDGCCPDCKLPGDDCPLKHMFSVAFCCMIIHDFQYLLEGLQPCVPSSLYLKVGEFTESSSSVSNVPRGVAV
ncbi:hypothetical protein ACH5RR_012895, partial [Cinchona calisaya]